MPLIAAADRTPKLVLLESEKIQVGERGKKRLDQPNYLQGVLAITMGASYKRCM